MTEIYIREKFENRDNNSNTNQGYTLAKKLERDLRLLSNHVDTSIEEINDNKNDMGGETIENVGDPTDDTDAANKQYVDISINNMKGQRILNVGNPVSVTDGANQGFVSDSIRNLQNSLERSKNDMGGNTVTNVGDPILKSDAVNRKYIDAVHLTILDEFEDSKNNMEGEKVINVGDPTDGTDAVNKQYVDDLNTELYEEITNSKNNMTGEKIINVANPTNNTDAANKQYVDNTKTNMNGERIKNVGTPTGATDGANKDYVDEKIRIARKFRNLNNTTIKNVGDAVNDGDAVNKRVLDQSIVDIRTAIHSYKLTQNEKNNDIRGSVRLYQDFIFNKNLIKKLTLTHDPVEFSSQGVYRIMAFEVDRAGNFLIDFVDGRDNEYTRITLNTSKHSGEFIDVMENDIFFHKLYFPYPKMFINRDESTDIDEITMYYIDPSVSYDIPPAVDFSYALAPELNTILINLEKPTIFPRHKVEIGGIDFDRIYRGNDNANLYEQPSFNVIKQSYFINKPYTHVLAYKLMTIMKKDTSSVPFDFPHIYVNKQMREFYLRKIDLE